MSLHLPCSIRSSLLALGAVSLLACGAQTAQQPVQTAAAPPPAPAPRNIVDNSGPLASLTAERVAVDLSKPEPDAVYWDSVVGGTVTLMGQPMVAPRPETATTDAVQVQALHDGTRIAFRLRWKDTEVSDQGQLAKYSDAIALEFPALENTVPPVMMGTTGLPVSLYHWRAQYQRDEEHGKPSTEQLYPNASVDMYQHDYKTAPTSNREAAERYSPAKAVGNPQSYPKKAVDVILAEGYSTSAVQANDGAVAHGEWKDGYWTVVISRPLASTVGGVLKPGTASYVAFAAWQGGRNEVGSRKCVTMAWTPLEIR